MKQWSKPDDMNIQTFLRKYAFHNTYLRQIPYLLYKGNCIKKYVYLRWNNGKNVNKQVQEKKKFK